MERTYINEVQKEIGSTVKVQGFIENLRNSKYMAFIVLKDITGKLQITVEKEDHPELVDTIDKLTPDSVITVTGKVMENDYVKMGGIEMIPEAIEIESIADALPIVRKEIAATKKKKAVERSSIDQRIDYRWIDLRTDENQLMFKAQSCFVNAMRQFLLERSFIEIHTPKLIAAASESGSEVFKVDYFDRNAYLAQSPQFYKQMAMAAGFERIFETGPVFRAEKSYTNKHSTEFSGFDLEFSYITSYKDVMKMEEELLTAGLKAVKEQYGEQIKELFGLEVVVPTTPFPVVKLADLYKALEEELVSRKNCNLKGTWLFWNMVDRRGRKDLYDAWNRVIDKMGLRLLSSHIPNTLRYNREAAPVCKGVFRSTLFPPDPRQEKSSGLPELVEEICRTIGLEESDTDR